MRHVVAFLVCLGIPGLSAAVPTTPPAPRTRATEETTELGRRRYDENLGLMSKLISATPDSDPALPDLIGRRAELHLERAGRLASQAEAAKTEPGTAALWRAEVAILEAEALAEYRELLARFPQYPRRDAVHFMVAWLHCIQGDDVEVKAELMDLVRRYPLSKHTATAYGAFGARLDLPGYAQWVRDAKAVVAPPIACPPAERRFRFEAKCGTPDFRFH